MRGVDAEVRDDRPELGVRVAASRVVEVDDGERRAVDEDLVERDVAVAEARLARAGEREPAQEAALDRGEGATMRGRDERDPGSVVVHL